MKALLFRKSIPRYVLLKLLGGRFRGLSTGAASPLLYCETPAPRLPSPNWVRIAPTLAGICGSDLAAVTAKGSTYLAPLTSMPFVMGHELVGKIVEVGDRVRGVATGDRVVLHPALGCAAREIDPPCAQCRDGREALCRNVTRGVISSGIQTGYCRDTGGGFGENLVAHRSQVYRVPDDLPDRAAVLIEPFSCALHGVLRAKVGDAGTVLVIGCGAIGLLTIAALRATGSGARILAVAKYDHQRQHARSMGADECIPAGGSVSERYRAWAEVLGAEVIRPELGKPAVIGGADVVFDCVASSSSIDDGLRFTDAGGEFVLIGMPGIPKGVDWTPMWYKELSVHAAYAYGPERTPDGVKDTFELAMGLLRTHQAKLGALVGKAFELSNWRSAFRTALQSGTGGAVKTVFSVGGN
jgi:threonine dehydrogenase-like Zn-dependent dehydrogenase